MKAHYETCVLRISSSNCGALATLSRFLNKVTFPSGLLGRMPTHSDELGGCGMTISSLLSGEQITTIKDHLAGAEITDADFNRIEVMGDLIRHIDHHGASVCVCPPLGTGGRMLTLRTLAIVVTGAGVFAGLPLTDARACDDDRYPCPVRLEALTQETADVPTQPAPSAQPQKKSALPQKKAKQPAGPNEKAHAEREREAPEATAGAKATKPSVPERTTDSVSQTEANPAVFPSPRAEESPNGERLVTTAGTAWPVFPSTDGAGVSVLGATDGEPTEAADANAVQLVDPNEVNELDRAAAATESSWSTYLLLILGAALAAASALWFFAKMIPVYARRAAGPRMHMRSEW
jgi:hypothetical protein